MSAGDTLKERASIVLAIAAKDIVDAIKNRILLSLVFGMALMVLSVQIVPLLLKMSGTVQVIVYDAGQSSLVDVLGGTQGLRLIAVESRQELEEKVVAASSEVLGIVIPAGFDSMLDGGGQPELDGYVAWADRSTAADLKQELERHVQGAVGQPVAIRVEGNLLYPPPESTGRLGMVAGVMVLVLAVIGSFLVPYLMIEEKEMHTWASLLVSPASISQVVAAKALVGLVYCLVAAAVVLVLNYSAVVRWDIAILASVCGAVLFVATGLVVGSLFESMQEMGLWVAIPFLLFLTPVILDGVGVSLSETIRVLVSWLPTNSLLDAYLLSFSGGATLAQALPGLAFVLAWAVPFYAAVVWIVRRSDR
jgi:ABC-2 type transport system permease protein